MKTLAAYPLVMQGQYWGASKPLRLLQAKETAYDDGTVAVEFLEWLPDALSHSQIVLPIMGAYLFYQEHVVKEGPFKDARPGDVWMTRQTGHIFFVLPWMKPENSDWVQNGNVNVRANEENSIVVGYDDPETSGFLGPVDPFGQPTVKLITRGPPPTNIPPVWDRLDGVDD